VIYFFLAFGNPNMQITALRLLCCLLPIPNRDTLKVLLEFLAEVAQCAGDTIDDKGNEVSFLLQIVIFFYFLFGASQWSETLYPCI